MNPAPRQHTPGPWSLSPSFDRVERRVQHGDAPPLVWGIARGLNSAHPDYLPRAEQIANARLIAAAPELLAALEAASELAEGTVKLLRQLDMESGRIAAECVLRDARAAIARATTGGNAA